MSLRRTLTVAALGFAVAGGAHAQTAVENRDADALAADMRILAANPVDIEALITAGELTLRMGDTTAAAGFFTRAEKLDPNNPRVKAGMGSLMVRAERPGMALLRFQEAERRGLSPSKFAADRGLAYDLIGQQDRAQRDYRLALADGPDDEATRRYALSLGISGQKDEALRLLDPLVRRSDRAAWRDRAFILAMSGDTNGAERIAATMMSPGLGAGLTPFFRRLSQLSAVDRAFAVNFGELATTPERIADAQLVPPLPRLGPDPYAPREVAAAVAVVTPPVDDGRKRKRRRKDDLAPAVPAVAAAAPVEVALAPPAYVPPRGTSAPGPTPTPPPVRVAAASPNPALAPAPVTIYERPAPSPAPAPSPVPPPNPAPTPAIEVAATTPPAPPADPTPGVADQPSASEAGVPAPTATARVSEDTVLSRIVASLDQRLPASAPPPRRAPSPTPVAVAKIEQPVAAPKSKPGSTRTRAKPAADDLAAAAPPPAKSRGKDRGKDEIADASDTKARAAKPAKDEAPPLDKSGCPIPPKSGKGKGAAKSSTKDKPVLSARCKAAQAKADEKAKADAAAKGEPARVWVQVAGGANEASLEKAWAAQKAKAPDLFRGRQGWTTPLRATNRVLTGPFKSEEEAQDFVNRMAKAGLSGFVFTSAKGQKIERLGSK
ncbi:MAG: SPOR domain-containing protein [Sphingomonas sp.]|uniref:SPOR domain-containing protein n=1 Tax=Sphingomonas sp. TaxID=28214 RepID=UPI00120340B5|nr:SPOR domain-containing protein [Sphingomonas sp.]THD37720.1 MAG: SPOR domain-containing protein [Sphingomonas sp.]